MRLEFLHGQAYDSPSKAHRWTHFAGQPCGVCDLVHMKPKLCACGHPAPDHQAIFLPEPTIRFAGFCAECWESPAVEGTKSRCLRFHDALPWAHQAVADDAPARNELAAIRLFLGLKDGESILERMRADRARIDLALGQIEMHRIRNGSTGFVETAREILSKVVGLK
jgi:hypothetical protein